MDALIDLRGGVMFVLCDHVKYRRERFGGIVLDTNTKATRFFNATGAQLIEACANAYEIAEHQFRSAHDAETAAEFLRTLVTQNLVRETDESEISRAELFFTETTDFPEHYFYTPLGVEAEITLKCFRRCVYCCYESAPTVNTSKDLSAEDWKSALRRLHDDGVFYVRFTGGDPLVRDDFLEILDYADRLNLMISVGSDLTALREHHAKALSACRNLVMLQTTLDGATAEVADALRGPGNWRKVIAGLDLLRKHHVPVVVGTVLRSDNIGQIKDIARLVRAHGAVGFHIAPLYLAGRGRLLEHLVPTNAELSEAYRAFREAIDDGLTDPVDPAWLHLTGRYSCDEMAHLWDEQPYLIRKPDRLLRLDPQGRCYTSIQVKEVIGDAVYVGNILEQSLAEIWHKAPLLSVLRSFENDESSIFGEVIDIRRVSESLQEATHV